MNAHEKTSAPLRGAEHYNQIDPSPNVRKSLDTTEPAHPSHNREFRSEHKFLYR